jgi:hypothetical protein
MTEKRFYKVAEIYGCHVTRRGVYGQTTFEIASPSYGEIREMDLGDVINAPDAQIIAMLTELSDKKLANYWIGGAT